MDEDLRTIEAVRAGDAEAFAPLIRRHQGRVFALCVSLLRDPVEAESAAHEVFVKAFRSLEQFRGEAAFSTWLTRVAFRYCQDVLRWKRRRREESWEGLLEEQGPAIERLLHEKPFEDALEAEDLRRRVLDSLPPDYREVLALREGAGMSYEEIAGATETTVESVRARLRRARASVLERLRHLSGPGGV